MRSGGLRATPSIGQTLRRTCELIADSRTCPMISKRSLNCPPAAGTRPAVGVTACLLVAAVFAPPLSAQSKGTADDPTPNLDHRRHMHRHNAPHPTEAPDGSRFHTTRSSDVVLPLPHEKDAFVFAVFGDRTGGPPEGIDVLADAVRDVNLIEPDLVMTVGDLINGYNRPDEWLEQMREYKAIMSRLLCPWFPVAGNHDVYWRPLDDPDRPRDHHEENYETHFGPLWYSFEHKNCNFIVLYSDEGNPESGKKTFSEPAAQKISPDQMEFLQQALERGADSHHQFLFLHHPRWLGGGYGDDWKRRVHPMLKEAGNVTAVFAGHIHRMRYDPQDDIEYVTLATVGGGQSETVPDAGFLHHYHLVTVRKDQVAMAAFPVGEAINVREITGELQAETVTLARQRPELAGAIRVTDRGPEPTEVEVRVDNPTSRAIDYTLTPLSRDNRWVFSPDHTHGHLEAGESETLTLAMRYRGTELDKAFDTVRIALAQDYLAPTTRYQIPEVVTEVELEVDLPTEPKPQVNRALALDGDGDTVKVPSDDISLPQGPMTLECWFRAATYGERVGLLAKTQNSEYGIFVSRGQPIASLHLGGSYRNVRPDVSLETGKWHHIAMVYDGQQRLTLYLDGRSVGENRVDPRWKRTPNERPLFIGADPNGGGQPMSFFHGAIDEVRLSKSARYTSDFEPQRRLTADDDTVLFYPFDRRVGPMVLDRGPAGRHARLRGDAHLTDVAR